MIVKFIQKFKANEKLNEAQSSKELIKFHRRLSEWNLINTTQNQ